MDRSQSLLWKSDKSSCFGEEPKKRSEHGANYNVLSQQSAVFAPVETRLLVNVHYVILWVVLQILAQLFRLNKTEDPGIQ